MCKRFVVMILSLLLVMPCVGFRAENSQAAEQTRPAAQKWEYKVVVLRTEEKKEATDKEKTEAVEGALNELGEQGWELVQVHFIKIGIFKRPKP